MTDFSAGRMWTRALAAAAMALGLGVGSAMAAPCPSDGLSPPDVTRTMDVSGPGATDQATCYAYGAGNPTTGNVNNDIILNGGANGVGQTTFTLDANFSQPYVFPTIQLIEDIDRGETGTYLSWTGEQSGTFTIAQAVPGFLELLVALKMGAGQGDPDWFAWTIPNVAGTYDWAWDEFANGAGPTGLSGIGLYGTIPLPAAAWLMVAGVGALGLAARRRKAREA